jgi:hypothetical protein
MAYPDRVWDMSIAAPSAAGSGPPRWARLQPLMDIFTNSGGKCGKHAFELHEFYSEVYN